MADALATYVHDHLAGAQLAVTTLEGLRDESPDKELSKLAVWLLTEIQADREQLQEFSEHISGDEKTVKETAAWIVQRASTMKLSPADKFGSFEALELICLGIQGKLALWNVLKALRSSDQRVAGLDVERLIKRASEQHDRTERLRIALAEKVFAAE